MAASARGILIVTLTEGNDSRTIRKRVAGIPGVESVEFNSVTGKLIITYDHSSEAMLREINLRIREVINGKSASARAADSRSRP